MFLNRNNFYLAQELNTEELNKTTPDMYTNTSKPGEVPQTDLIDGQTIQTERGLVLLSEFGITAFNEQEMDNLISRLEELKPLKASSIKNIDIVIREINSFSKIDSVYWKKVHWDNLIDSGLLQKSITKILLNLSNPESIGDRDPHKLQFKTFNSSKHHKRCLKEFQSGSRKTLPIPFVTVKFTTEDRNHSGSWLTATNSSTREDSSPIGTFTGTQAGSDWTTNLTKKFGLGVLPPRQTNSHWLVDSPTNGGSNRRRGATHRGNTQTHRQRERRTDRLQDEAADKLCDLMAKHGRIVFTIPSGKQGLAIKNFGPQNLDELSQPKEDSILIKLLRKHGEREPLTSQSELIFYPEAINDSFAQEMRQLILQMIKETINVEIFSRTCVRKLLDKFKISVQILLHQFTRSRVLGQIHTAIGEGQGYRITMTHAASKNAIKFFVKKRFDLASWAIRIIGEQYPTGNEDLNPQEVNMVDDAICVICDSLWYTMNLNKLGDRSES